ncbi:CAP domain-containing protein [Streptomyces rubiginosohelvolus]|uniref:CAP domain-containing protein n=1 Tax=Streptomyces rubiginosohelvolus TaxID=67362 RepID=UPI003701088D
MGRHRRSAAGPAAEEPAAGAASRRRGTRRKKSAVPIRTGLLGVSAAVAVGAVAVASGLIPGNDTYTTGSPTASDQVRTGGAPDLLTQGGSSTAPADRSSSPASRGSERPEAPSTSPSKTPSKTPSPSKTSKAPSKSAAPSTSKKPAATPSKKSKAPTTAPEKSSPASKAPAPPKTSAAPPPSKKPSPSPTDASARSEVLALVNQERAKVGCSPLSTSAPLTSLAQNFSEDMAARGFFDHTDPDGDTPWDRAAQAGVQGLAAENIARGQADAQAVMEGWMNSEGHRANILNCDYKTIGIGVHEGSGGPWWVQNFGF